MAHILRNQSLEMSTKAYLQGFLNMYIKRKDGRATAVKVLDFSNWTYRVVVVDLIETKTLIDKGFVSFPQAETFYNTLVRACYEVPVCIIILNHRLKALKNQVKAAQK